MVILISFFSCTVLAATINLVTEDNPPFSYQDPASGKIEGISVNIVKQLFENAKINYTLSIDAWDKAYQQALNTPGYAVFSTAKLPEREKSFKWVGPIIVNDWVFLAKKDKQIKISELNDAKRYIIGGYKDDARILYLKSQGFTNFYLVDKDQENANSIKEGKIDLWITSLVKGSFADQQMEPLQLEKVYEIQKIPLYLAINKHTSNLLIRKLNAALTQMEQPAKPALKK